MSNNLFNRKRYTSHGLHAVLSLVTFGLWLWPWLVIALRNSSHNARVDDQIRLAEWQQARAEAYGITELLQKMAESLEQQLCPACYNIHGPSALSTHPVPSVPPPIPVGNWDSVEEVRGQS